MTRTLLLALSVGSSWFLPGPAAHGQAIRGLIVDDDTHVPIAGVSVMLIDGDRRIARGGLSGEEGRFLLEAPRTGRYTIRLERIGYESTSSTEIDLLPPDTVSVELRMSMEVVVMAPLTITSERGPLVMDTRLARWGYYDRRAEFSTLGSGVSHFLDREDIRRRNPNRPTDIFRDLHSVRVANMGFNRLKVVRPDGCGFTFYLDGVEVRMEDNDSIDDFIMSSHISAIEVYARPPYPAQYAPNPFNRRDRACGSIVIWTGFVGEGGSPPSTTPPVWPR
jgi:hypothetical protein